MITVYRGDIPLVKFPTVTEALAYISEWQAKGHGVGMYCEGVSEVSTVRELQLLQELDTLQARIEELTGLLEDEKAASAFLSGLVDSFAEGYPFTREQRMFLNDQYGSGF